MSGTGREKKNQNTHTMNTKNQSAAAAPAVEIPAEIAALFKSDFIGLYRRTRCGELRINKGGYVSYIEEQNDVRELCGRIGVEFHTAQDVLDFESEFFAD